MTEREKQLYEFYKQCLEKGYMNMHDSTESLKAKVIATDLGIKYKDISNTYQEARIVYDEEKKRIEDIKELQNISGELVLALNGSGKNETVSVYQGTNGLFYYMINNENFKYKGVPVLHIKSGGVLQYTYHPSKAVYTGASSGGIAMGGVHYTKAYMNEKVGNTGNGYIEIEANNLEFTLKKIELSEFIVNKFKRQAWFKDNLVNGKYIYCFDEKGKETGEILAKAAMQQTNYYDRASMASMAADSARLSMAECKIRVDFLNDVFTKNYPPSEETIYSRALSMENLTTSEKIKECIQLFETILDYKDSKERVENLQNKFEELLQYEKEQAILKKEEKEKARKKKLKTMGIVIPAVLISIILLVAGCIYFVKEKKNASDYQTAITYMNEKSYKDAVRIFLNLNEYHDSRELLEECCVLWLEQGNQYMEERNYEQALLCFEEFRYLPSNLQISEDTKKKLSEVDGMIELIEIEKNILSAIEEHNVSYLLRKVDDYEFRCLEAEEIQSGIVGEWYIVSTFDEDIVEECCCEADGTMKYREFDELGNPMTYSFTVSSEHDWLEVTRKIYKYGEVFEYTNAHDVYELRDGYYLLKFLSDSGYLCWQR